MVKTYLKTFLRMFARHKARLVSIILMVLVSVGFSAGIGMATDKMDYALDAVYRDENLYDLLIKSTRTDGFTDEERALLSSRYGEHLLLSSSLEFEEAATETTAEMFGLTITTRMTFEGVGNGVSKVYFYDMPPSDVPIDKLEVLEEAERPDDLPDSVYDVYVERETPQLKGYALGSTLKASVVIDLGALGTQTNEYSFFVRGIIENPVHMATRKDISLQFTDDAGEQKQLESIFYLFEQGPAADGGMGRLSPPANDAYITLERDGALVLSGSYLDRIRTEKAELEALFSPLGDAVKVLTLDDCFSTSSFHAYAKKIEGIGCIMMAVFLAVTLLVVLSTMTRLLEEERAQIACLSTLGYGPAAILVKYLLFALLGTIIGAFGGYFAGMGLAYIVYKNFEWNFALPPFPSRVSTVFYFLVAGVILASTLAATLISGLRKTGERPAVLLRPKAPRPGKKVILERIPILWERFSFRYKSSLRNVLRYKTRFLMTVVAVMASTALVLAGLAVLDCCIFQDVGTAAMIGVSVVVLVFAALLNFVVIYTLTNINISERERELATLMVLGYHDGEVAGYVYREIYLTGAIGIALGLPAGCLLCLFLFRVMEFGSLAAMNWYTWVLAPLLSLLFTFIVTLMLRHKIVSIRMNDSLKAVE